jgi:hypothetical protein
MPGPASNSPIIVRPVIQVPPPRVIVDQSPQNYWSLWIIPGVGVAAAFAAAVFGLLAYLAILRQIELAKKQIKLARRQVNLQQTEIDLVTEDLRVTRDQASKADSERARVPNLHLDVGGVKVTNYGVDQYRLEFTSYLRNTGQGTTPLVTLEVLVPLAVTEHSDASRDDPSIHTVNGKHYWPNTVMWAMPSFVSRGRSHPFNHDLRIRRDDGTDELTCLWRLYAEDGRQFPDTDLGYGAFMVKLELGDSQSPTVVPVP